MCEVPKAAFAVFLRGRAVANPAAWKSHAMAVQLLVGLFTAVIGLLRANGYDLPISDETLQYLAGGIAGLWFGGFGVYRDRKSVVEGKSVSVRVELGGRRIIKKK